MKEKALALPPTTIAMIFIFAIPIFLLIGVLYWQTQLIGQADDSIHKAEAKVQQKEQELSSLQAQLAMLRTIKKNYEKYLSKMEKNFDEAELNRERLTSYAPYPLEKEPYSKMLTELPHDIKTALSSTAVKRLETKIEESARHGFVLGTVKAYGTLKQLYNLKIELLRLAYVESVESSLIQEIAGNKHITLKFWVQIL